MDIFRRPLQKNSLYRRKLRRGKTSLSLVSMSSADELLNGNGRMAVNQYQGSSYPCRCNLLFICYCLNNEMLQMHGHNFFQLQEWCFLLWSGIVWVMSPVDIHWYKLEYKHKLMWLMNGHTIVLLLSVFIVVLSAFFLVMKHISQLGQCNVKVMCWASCSTGWLVLSKLWWLTSMGNYTVNCLLSLI